MKVILLFTLLTTSFGNLISLAKGQQLDLTDSAGKANVTAIILAAGNTKSKFAATSRIIKNNLNPILNAVPAPILAGISRITGRASSSNVALQVYGRDVLWYGTVSVGTPGQLFDVDFDTGSSDFLLVRSTCTGAGCTVDGDGTNRKVYNTTASSTSKVTTIAFSNSYVSGGSSTSGFVVRDTVHLGRLSAVQQAINAATTVGGSFQQLYADGLMGLGYPALSSSGLPSLPITLQSQRIINPALFAFRLSSTPKVSELSMGSVNPNKFTGTFTQFPIAKDAGYNVFTYFQIANSLANVNGVAIGGTAGTYILDTGTTLIISPIAQASAFWASIPNSAPLSGAAGYYTFPCTQPLTISFSFGGTNQVFALNINDFNLGYIDSPTGKCVGALIGSDLGIGSRTILGDVFLKSWYSSYNMGTNQVGFATPV